MSNKTTINILKRGGVGVIPTDTIYGLVACALNPKSIERVYHLKKRQPDKPLIVLISSIDDLKTFEIKLSANLEKKLKQYWPGKVSVVLSCRSNKFVYLHRGQNCLAFRLPTDSDLVKLIAKAGPLVAPSANPEGKEPAKSITEAKKYFGLQADFYLDGGILDSAPSKLIDLTSGQAKILRA